MKYFFYVLAALLVNSSYSFAQLSVEVGGQAGVTSERTLNNYLTGAASAFSSFQADPARKLIGPSFAFTYNDRFGVEVDVLYKSFDIHGGFTGGGTAADPRLRRTETLTHAKSWETSALFRYLFTSAPIRPFVTGGLSIPRMSGESETRVTILFTGEEVSRSSSRGPVHVDGQKVALVIGGGAEMKVQRLRLVPEFRYLWRSNEPQNYTTVIPSNQFEFLVGVRYRFAF